jgi:hypothetical protein
MDPTTATLVASALVAAITSAWLLLVYPRDKREARERSERILLAVDGLVTRLDTAAGAMRGGVDPRALVEAREEKAAQAAELEGTIVAELVEAFGPTWGPTIHEWAKGAFPDLWKAAMKRPDRARNMLAPVFATAGKMLAARKDDTAEASPFNPTYGR